MNASHQVFERIRSDVETRRIYWVERPREQDDAGRLNTAERREHARQRKARARAARAARARASQVQTRH